MILYRNHPGRDGGESEGYRWFATRREALDDAKRNPEDYDWDLGTVAERIDLGDVRSKEGLVSALNEWASYPDNG